jgi:hypothetical protein
MLFVPRRKHRDARYVTEISLLSFSYLSVASTCSCPLDPQGLVLHRVTGLSPRRKIFASNPIPGNRVYIFTRPCFTHQDTRTCLHPQTHLTGSCLPEPVLSTALSASVVLLCLTVPFGCEYGKLPTFPFIWKFTSSSQVSDDSSRMFPFCYRRAWRFPPPPPQKQHDSQPLA